MPDDDRENIKRNRKIKKSKKNFLKSFSLIFIIFTFIFIISSGIVFSYLYSSLKDLPEFDPLDITGRLYENSVIYDDKGTEIEKVQTEQFRSIISINDMNIFIQNAFIAVEDERFKEHVGVDIKGLFRALFENIKAKSFKQGASTITQQLSRNIYLSQEKEIGRKIKEMYIALQIEKVLTKEQILEAYLNTIYLGQGAHGVQSAAQIYFSKNAKDLTLAESAMIAGVTKNPSKYALYHTYTPDNVDKDNENIIGELEILGQTYIAVYNEKASERQKLILKKMLNLNMITENEYQNALDENMKEAIKPGRKKHEAIETSYFNDYVKASVINDLINENGYSKEEAENSLFTGGLKIYSTLNINVQSKIENIYNNFTSILSRKSNKANFVNIKYDKAGNIIDSYGNITFYKKDNIIDDNNNLIIEKGTYNIDENGDLIIKNNKINYRNLDVGNYYVKDDNNELITYSGRYINVLQKKEYENSYKIDKSSLVIKKEFLNENEDFYKINDKNNLLISSKYIFSPKGVLQPQSAVVIFDYNSGQIKGIVGGRGIKGEKIFNRATDAPRQPGSSIKPLSVYIPALDNKFTASTIIDDIPHYYNGDLWPKNWYTGFKGLVTLRYSVEQSINVSAVKVLEQLGINKSLEYLTRLGVINEDDGSLDTFVTGKEAKSIGSGYFDENIASLSLGGMTKGLTPLTMTVAYGAIANNGIYNSPIAYTKVLDRYNNVILEKKSKQNIVVPPNVSYLMTDILKSVVTRGTGRNAQIYSGNVKIPVAGKTGTTQNKTDQWFVGFTPYYSCGVWVGNDSQSIKLGEGSNFATRLWGHIMRDIHKNLPQKSFTKPSGIISKNICTVSGELATELCHKDPRGSKVMNERFIKGTEPLEYCETHVEVAIDPNTGLLVNEECPPEIIEYKVFIKRVPPYEPSSNLGIVPADFIYTVPSKVSSCPIEPEEDDDIDDSNNEDIEDNDKTPEDNTNNETDENTNKKENILKNIEINIFDIINDFNN